MGDGEADRGISLWWRQLLGRTPDADVAPGAKFETFVSADRVLALTCPAT